MMLYVVGIFIADSDDGVVWELQSIFDNETDAVNECKTANYFIGPIELNALFPHEQTEWPGSYYPIKAEVDEL